MTYAVRSRARAAEPIRVFEPVLDIIQTSGPWALEAGYMTSFGSNSWETVNRTVYLPIYVPTKCTVRRLFWANGAIVAGGATITVGVYTSVDFKPNKRLTSAGAVQGTASQLQFVTASPIVVLVPDVYWLALHSTSVTSTEIMAFSVTGTVSDTIKFQETGAPPATATPVESGNGAVYMYGFATVDSP